MSNFDNDKMCDMILEELIANFKEDEHKEKKIALSKKRKLIETKKQNNLMPLLCEKVLQCNMNRIKKEVNKSDANAELLACIAELWLEIKPELERKLVNNGDPMTLDIYRQYAHLYRKKIVYTCQKRILSKLKGVEPVELPTSTVMRSSNASKLFSTKEKEVTNDDLTNTCDSKYDAFCRKMYLELKREKQLHAFQPKINKYEELGDYLQKKLNHNLICRNINPSAGDPTNFLKRKKGKELEYGIHTNMDDGEKEAFANCIEQLEAGLIGDLWIENLPGVGQVLYTNSIISRGCILTCYFGRYLYKSQIDHEIESTKQIGGENGHDLALGVFSHKKDSSLDTMLFPFKYGGIAQYASTCKPEDDDYLNVNCIAVPVLIQCKDGLQVQIFLVAIKDIEPGQPIVWNYRSAYFDNPLLKVDKWLTVAELSTLLKEYLNQKLSSD